MRKHYMTLFTRNKKGDVVTYVTEHGKIEVTVETPVKDGFKTAVIDEDCNILYSEGFDTDDLKFYQNFVRNNIAFIKELSSRGFT